MIRVNVDLCNPGQFFACCGLLELAFRLDANAEGSFVGNSFEVSGDAGSFLRSLVECRLDNTLPPDLRARLDALRAIKARDKSPEQDEEQKGIERRLRAEPLRLNEPFHLLLDWWNDKRAGGSRMKTWAGQQSALDIASNMKRALASPVIRDAEPADWLSVRAGEEVPFYFDASLGQQSSALDVGFSTDTQKISSANCPLLEFAAFVGFQRFRPVAQGDNVYHYSPWTETMGPMLAAVATAGHLPASSGPTFAFRLLFRNEYYKSFLPALPT